ncbi:MAG TPA: hypothetical protein VJ731_12195 [Terriglobales bacterium]|nr:hypothetical protein [Terriglobales bacterium]
MPDASGGSAVNCGELLWSERFSLNELYVGTVSFWQLAPAVPEMPARSRVPAWWLALAAENLAMQASVAQKRRCTPGDKYKTPI